MVCGVSWLSLRQLRKMKLPIWVMPDAAFEIAIGFLGGNHRNEAPAEQVLHAAGKRR